MARYLYVVYKPESRPAPYGAWLLCDIFAFTCEAALFFVMSRAVQLHQWRRFYWTVVTILAVDSVWAALVYFSHLPEILPWLILNLATLPVFLVILIPRWPKRELWVPFLAVVVMAVRTGVDYWSSRDFYFPPSSETRRTGGEGERKTSIYFAGPLFTQAEWRWNAALTGRLRSAGFTVTLPQERALPMLSGKERFDGRTLFLDNVNAIDRADVTVAVLDGADLDSGTCWEAGYAYKAGKPVVGVRTDLRLGGDDPKASVNLMLAQSCKELITVSLAKRDDVAWVGAKVTEAVRRVSKGSESK
jgi:nucleoside 2-deoxyribosyltransferase